VRIFCHDCALAMVTEDALPVSMGRAYCSECGRNEQDCYELEIEGEEDED
jgi:hypothetical protein